MTERKSLKVFISSPSDVRPEREIARRVVERIAREFAYHFDIQAVMWEREPLVASQHFQEGITPPSETDIVVVILWSKLGVELPVVKFPGPISRKPVTGTEWEFEDALKANRERRAPDLLMYRKRAQVTASLDDEELLKQQLAQKKLVEQFITTWFIDQDAQSYTAAFRDFADMPGFEDMLETHLRELVRKRLINTGVSTIPGGIRWHKGSPFRGLLSFELEHAPIFFGRTRARNELREVLERQIDRGCAFLLVVGASGSGKSSLVKAGLLPDLKLQGMIGRVGLVRHAVFRPSDSGGDPVAALARAILAEGALPELASLHYDAAALRDALLSSPTQVKVLLLQALTAAGQASNLTEIAEARLAIVVDQLEEMFTIEGIEDKDRDAFVAALEALATSGLAWVVATMRSDFFDRLETQPRLLELSSGEGRYVIPPPEPNEIAQIIQQPAREAGLTFETDATRGATLADELARAAMKGRGALPLLSFLLDQLWTHRSDGGVLTFRAYEDLGGLEGALGRRAEEIFSAQPPEVQAALPILLRSLVTVGHGDKGAVSSRTASLSKFAPGSPARLLIDAFADKNARLLVLDDQSTQSGNAVVRLAHEALLTHWWRARDQIAADARDLELLERLETEAGRWHDAAKNHRDALVLPGGLRLLEASDLLRRWKSEVPALVSDFVVRSRRVARRRRTRIGLAIAAAVAALPVIAGIAWTVMVWRGVQAVEQEMRFTTIPSGCFVMGSPPGEEGRFDEFEQQHNVCVPSFRMGTFDVTQQEWRQVMVENPDPARFKGSRNPVEMVSWNDARAFAWRMSFFGHYKYRLPSEAEWEYAARAGTTTPWFWGDKVEDGCAYANIRDQTYAKLHFNVGEAIINCEDGHDSTSPVGSYRPNRFGLYDMIGDVFQWTQDCFRAYDADTPSDGRAVDDKHCELRVDRGGSWTAKPRFIRAASRDAYPPVNRNDVVGFRLVREP